MSRNCDTWNSGVVWLQRLQFESGLVRPLLKFCDAGGCFLGRALGLGGQLEASLPDQAPLPSSLP